jgi:Tfp pilus assembly major pilin PilA
MFVTVEAKSWSEKALMSSSGVRVPTKALTMEPTLLPATTRGSWSWFTSAATPNKLLLLKRRRP